uniref:Gabre protein n=1 Tax=Fopius arisanus TaxID=64838 RepID=A0A0C9QLM5_9HYME
MDYPYVVPSGSVLPAVHGDGEIIYYIDTLEDPDCNIHGLYPSSPRSQPSRSSSICSQIDKPQRYRRSVDVGYPIKQSTGQTGSRPRPKSTRFTPLGNFFNN